MRGRVHLSFRSPTAEAGLDPYSDVRCAGKTGRRVCRRLVSENRMGTPPSQRIPRLFGRGSWLEVRRITDLLRAETAGGMLLVGAAVFAFVWSNSPWRDAYSTLGSLRVGPSALHLHLTLAQWAADGMLAIYRDGMKHRFAFEPTEENLKPWWTAAACWSSRACTADWVGTDWA